VAIFRTFVIIRTWISVILDPNCRHFRKN